MRTPQTNHKCNVIPAQARTHDTRASPTIVMAAEAAGKIWQRQRPRSLSSRTRRVEDALSARCSMQLKRNAASQMRDLLTVHAPRSRVCTATQMLVHIRNSTAKRCNAHGMTLVPAATHDQHKFGMAAEAATQANLGMRRLGQAQREPTSLVRSQPAAMYSTPCADSWSSLETCLGGRLRGHDGMGGSVTTQLSISIVDAPDQSHDRT